MANKALEKETFPFSGWTVEVQRRAFRRSVSIQLRPQQPIRVLAPKLVSQKSIYEFLLKKKDWIEKHLKTFEEHVEKFPPRKIRAAETFPFMGQELSLRLVITLLKTPFVSMQEGELLLHIPRGQWTDGIHVQEHPELLAPLRLFYKREAIKKISERVAFWSGQMNLHPRQLRFREQRTRWGSCSSRRFVNLNWRLIVFKPEIIDYVIVHELAHLQHMNHSAHFWGLVAQYIPNYEVSVKDLRESQAMVEFLSPKC